MLAHDSTENTVRWINLYSLNKTKFISHTEEFYHLRYNAVQSAKSQLTFRKNMSPYLQSRRISRARNQGLLATCFRPGLLGLFFDPEDGGDMFLRNVGWVSTDYTALAISKKTEHFITTAVRNLRLLQLLTSVLERFSTSSVTCSWKTQLG
jgi:hypothetical protein